MNKKAILLFTFNIIIIVNCQDNIPLTTSCIPPVELPQSTQSPPSTASIENLSLQLDKFNSLYLTNLEQKMTAIMSTISSLDANIKALQERAHVWEIFHHHINAWSDHMKSVDNKLEFLKRAVEAQTNVDIPLETRVIQIDSKIQNVFNKIDLVNEKFHDVTKQVYDKKKCRISNENNSDLNLIIKKIDVIEKQIRFSQINCNSNYRSNNSHRNQHHQGIPRNLNYQNVDRQDLLKLKSTLDRTIVAIEKISPKELRQIANINRRSLRTLEGVEDSLHELDERTIRIYDTGAAYHKKMMACCSNTEHEIATFTSSADILLKKIENVVLTLGTKNLFQDSILFENNEEVGSGSNEIEHDSIEIDKTAQGCEELIKRKNRIYNFGTDKRFCYFGTEGPAWTIIQSRGFFYGFQELFNRTWNDYELGFGKLNKEFWYGNLKILNLLQKSNHDMEMRIELKDYDSNLMFIEYSTFSLSIKNYQLKAKFNRGSARDLFAYYKGQKFSTIDRLNDEAKSRTNECPEKNYGWWFIDCFQTNLNGNIGQKYKSTKIMIRPKWIPPNIEKNYDDEYDEE